MRSSFLELALRSGKRIYLDSFHVSLSYAGLLEGKIQTEFNEMVLTEPKFVLRRFYPEFPAILLNEAELRRKVQSMLPELLFVGKFSIDEVNPATGEMPIFFAVAWFQEDLNPIMSTENMEDLKKIDVSEVLRSPNIGSLNPKKSWFDRIFK